MSTRDIRSLDVGLLRTFQALVHERSVSRAAARLFVTQPAVSASLTRLREVFGDPLFTRAAHGVVPTARAQALAPQVDRLLQDLARLLDDDAPFDPAASSRIFRIAGSDFASSQFLAPLSRRLIDAGSAVRLSWEPASTGAIGQRLDKGEIDLAVLSRIRRPHDMETELLYEDRYVYVLRKGHPRAAGPITLDDFCSIPQIFHGYGHSVLEDLIDEALAREGRRRHAQLAVSGLGQIIHQLLHSDHAGVIGERLARRHQDELAIHPVPMELPPYHGLVCWSASAASDPGVRWLRDEVVRIAAQAA
ncbi:LysR family transcriptional regulator [Ramlibacter sp. AW1]|uniref:LysR family transcriptional regulator n=1 Tax=Ramlibacter aurantiacus TaxID=2801330 RepID=A0A937D651_9BURK|nr:LysR family transcriptional regulator [Ramlibacter aurantiacus]MBL0420593.1 LysR family transcriptional regulator [Ramlibacter aurantiacus]